MRILRSVLAVPFVLLLVACQPALDVREQPPAPPIGQQAAPGWLPIHLRPRVGDFAIHRQLDASGLTLRERRSEVTRVAKIWLEVRQHFNDPDSPTLHYRLSHTGKVLSAWIVVSGGTERLPRPIGPMAKQQRQAVHEDTPLRLVSGNYRLDRIVTRSLDGDDNGSLVDYLSDRIPFASLVSLSGKQALSHREAVRLISRIAILDKPDARTSLRIPVSEGWVLMQWGRGNRSAKPR